MQMRIMNLGCECVLYVYVKVKEEEGEKKKKKKKKKRWGKRRGEVRGIKVQLVNWKKKKVKIEEEKQRKETNAIWRQYQIRNEEKTEVYMKEGRKEGRKEGNARKTE